MIQRLFAPLGLLLGAASLPFGAVAQVALPDLTVSQVIVSPPSQGGTATVRVTATNLGSAPHGVFQVVGGILAGGSLSTVGARDGSCAKGRNSVYTCGFTGLAPGMSTEFELTTRIDRTAPVMTVYAAVAVNGDANFGNNSTTVTVPVLAAPPDVAISGSASTGSPVAGSVFTYTYQVKVGGSVPAPGVVFTNAVPAELSLVGASTSLGTVCSLAGSVLSCPLGDMAAGSQAVVTLTVQASAASGTAIANTGAAMAGDGRDANATNNSVTVNVTTR